MTEYYFLASLLPQLEIGHIPSLGFAELMELMQMNLTEEDKAKVKLFLRLIDFENLRAYWAEEPFELRGNIRSKEEMEEALLHSQWGPLDRFPYFLHDYLDKYGSREERLEFFPVLMSRFFDHYTESEKGFLCDFFLFQREMRLVMVGFRAKKTRRDVAVELQYEDPTDPIVAQILAQKDAKSYEPPFEYKELKPIFEEFADAPFDLHQAIVAYQFNTIVERWGGEIFSIDRILSYLARLILCERWLELDMKKGIEIIDTIEKDLK